MRLPPQLLHNPSIEVRPYGAPPSPRVHSLCHQPQGPGVTPSAPAWFERLAAKTTVVVSPTFFESPLLFRAWLEANHATAAELIVGFRKVGSGLPSMTWPESVDEALCFGWIDGVRKRIDDEAYLIRFTPRRAGSIWSLVNVAKVVQLQAQGRLRPSGTAAFEARNDKRTGIYAFEREHTAELTAAETRDFKTNKVAWRYFESAPPSYRKVMTHWVVSAKRAATRERRLAQLIQACAEQRRMLK
jgi:uncharacterized protein YdeI (YjbR/CyaY-like superfamily)